MAKEKLEDKTKAQLNFMIPKGKYEKIVRELEKEGLCVDWNNNQTSASTTSTRVYWFKNAVVKLHHEKRTDAFREIFSPVFEGFIYGTNTQEILDYLKTKYGIQPKT